jgi:hypothetical protein
MRRPGMTQPHLTPNLRIDGIELSTGRFFMQLPSGGRVFTGAVAPNPPLSCFDALRALKQAHQLSLDQEKLSRTPRRQRKPRKPTLVGVAKQASKAGIEVARYEVKPDGTVVVVTSRPESAEPENPWLDDLNDNKVKQ